MFLKGGVELSVVYGTSPQKTYGGVEDRALRRLQQPVVLHGMLLLMHSRWPDDGARPSWGVSLRGELRARLPLDYAWFRPLLPR